MGCFDSVNVPCPTCKRLNEFQSKADVCAQISYQPSKVPIKIAEDIHGEEMRCDQCNTLFRIVKKPPNPKYMAMKAEIVDDDD